ncbi:MAG: hypothetical protein KJS92_03580, partial [Bacteroidetes bacterium]|nr:hypothetical protein [Bacteroidota bacterium]
TVNDSGIVTLRWKSNKESDLQGYLIYFSNSPKAEFSGLVNTPMEDTLFFDTLSLRMLNRDVYYGIEAVDHRMNRSGMTAMVKVLRPDTLPPVEPVFRSYQVGDSFIRLVWFPSSSIDVTNQLLTRQNSATGEIITLKFKPTDSSYTDDALEAGQLYKYNLFALDESNNRSPIGTTLELKTYRNTFLNPVKGFNAVYDSLSRVVIIRWEIPELPAKKTIIYKGSSPETVSATPIPVKEDEHEAFDLRPKTGTTYYSVKIIFENGTQTLLSKPIGVTVR